MITIPEMDVLQIPLTESSLAWTHANNTLIVTYNKPRKVLEAVRATHKQLCTVV